MPAPSEPPSEQGTLGRFLAHARTRPEAVAVHDESGELSYGALEAAARTRALAREMLQGTGVSSK